MKREKNYIKREAISLVTNTIVGMMSLIAISYIIGYAIKTGNTIVLALAIVLIIVVVAALILGLISSFALFDGVEIFLRVAPDCIDELHKTLRNMAEEKKNLKKIIEAMRANMKHNYPEAQDHKVNIWDISVPKHFKYPSEKKYKQRKEFFERNGRTKTPIVVKGIGALTSEVYGYEYELVDGYISYLIALEDGQVEVEAEKVGNQKTLEKILGENNV